MKRFYNVITMVLVVVLVFLNCDVSVLSYASESGSNTVSNNTISENDVKENGLTVIGVSEKEVVGETAPTVVTDEVNPLGVQSKRNSVEEQIAELGNNYFTLKTVDTGTWSFEQTFARGELFKELNDARMNEDNWWYWTSHDGVSKTYPTVTNAYEYDVQLEEVAMQRAIELVYSYSRHKRPTGISYYEAYKDLYEENGNPYWYCSNVNELHGNDGTTAEEIVAAYMEEDKTTYAGQEHRIAILADTYYRVGIGCIKTADGKYFTVIEIAEDHYEYEYGQSLGDKWDFPAVAPTTENCVDGYKEMELKIKIGNPLGLEEYNCHRAVEDVALIIGETYTLDDKNYCSSTNGAVLVPAGHEYYDYFDNGWYSEDESVVTVSDGVVTAVGEGVAAVVVKNDYIRAAVGFNVTAPKTEETTPPTTPVTPPSLIITTDPVTPTAPTDDTDISDEPVVKKLAGQKIKVAKKFRKTFTIKKKSLTKKKKTYKINAVVNNGKKHGKVTYKVVKYPKGAKNHVKVSKKGTITVKKNAKKGTYKIRITAAAVKGKYLKTTKTITIKIK